MSPSVKWKLQYYLPHSVLCGLIKLTHVKCLGQHLAHSQCSINVLHLFPKSRLSPRVVRQQKGTLLGKKHRQEGRKEHRKRNPGGTKIKMPSWNCALGISCRQVHRTRQSGGHRGGATAHGGHTLDRALRDGSVTKTTLWFLGVKLPLNYKHNEPFWENLKKYKQKKKVN